jgi:ribosome biogenesis GTPase
VADELTALGWDDRWADAFEPYRAEGFVPARVAIEFNHIFRALAESGELRVEHAGRLKHRAEGRADLAAVGDWVAVRVAPDRRQGTIEAVVPRRSRFSRKVAGEVTQEQVVAANIDTVFLVMGLDGDYNPRRLERYLLLAHESGASPVVLLSKADLAPDLPAALAEITPLAGTAPVYAISVVTRAGLDEVLGHLGRGRTGALLGSSGVGKSTLINALTGDARLATQEVRASDSRGRHTTRHRQLIALPGECGLLIDTPGMRELQVWDATGAIVEAFDDIESLAADCHFRDCRHRDEPRCAVRQAVAEGRLDEGRWTSYLKLQDERDAIERRKDVRARIEEKRTGKVIGRAIKAMYRLKGRS